MSIVSVTDINRLLSIFKDRSSLGRQLFLISATDIEAQLLTNMLSKMLITLSFKYVAWLKGHKLNTNCSEYQAS